MIKKSTIASTGLHIVIILLLFIFQQTSNILIPSRSDGMEVSLVSPEELKPSPRIIPKVSVVDAVKTQSIPAEVNLNKQKPKPITVPKEEVVQPPEKITEKIVSKPK